MKDPLAPRHSQARGGTLQGGRQGSGRDPGRGRGLRTSARRGDRSFEDVLETHVYRFAGGRVTEFHATFDDQYAVDAVLG